VVFIFSTENGLSTGPPPDKGNAALPDNYPATGGAETIRSFAPPPFEILCSGGSHSWFVFFFAGVPFPSFI